MCDSHMWTVHRSTLHNLLIEILIKESIATFKEDKIDGVIAGEIR